MSAFDWLTADTARALAAGMAVTLALTIITSATSFVVGVAAAIGRRSRRPWARRTAGVFVDIFRNVPALILLIFFAFAVPNLFPAGLRRTLFFDNAVVDALAAVTRLPLPYYACAAVVALTVNTGAHLAEIVRAGMNAVPVGRIESARALGANARRAYFSITIPDGVRIAFPGIRNRLIHNLKNTALVSFVAVPDLFQEVQSQITRTFSATRFLIVAAVLYLVLTTLFEFALTRIERSLWRGQAVDRRIGV